MDFVTEEEIVTLRAQLAHLESIAEPKTETVISYGHIDFCFDYSLDQYDVETRSDLLEAIYLCFSNDKDLLRMRLASFSN